jgi:hypothetical protein
MTKIMIGLGTGIAVLTAIILGLVYMDASNDDDPIQLVAICEGKGTKLVSCTWIPLEESKRTPEEKALAERAENE